MKELVFADGSQDFGNGVIGPNTADVEFFNSLSDTVTVLDPREKKIRNKNQFAVSVLAVVDMVPKPLRKPAQIALLTSAAGLSAGAVCGGDSVPKSSELQPRLTYSLTLPSAPGETWWYTAGPHYDEGSKSRVKYAIDITPTDKPISCPGGEPYMEKSVRAIADGVVTVVGNEKDLKDKNHSVVEIDHGSGFTSGSMHLAEMQVKVGQKVKQGDPLGYVSCEFPPGGGTSGEHLHLYGKLDGKPIEVDRIVMSGWTIEGTGENKQGTMTKSGEDIRTADTGRCGPQTYTIRQCDPSGKIRNDISWKDPQNEFIATPKAETVPTIALRPTMVPVPTVEKPVIPTVAPRVETRDQEIERKWNEAVGLGQKFIRLMLDGSQQAISEAQTMEVTPAQRRIYPDTEYDIAPFGDLSLCSQDMRAGQFQNWSAQKVSNFTRVNRGDSAADRLNKQQGLSPNDRYAVGYHFTFNQYNLSARARIGFRDYGDAEMFEGDYVVFEDTVDGLKLAKNELCFGIPSPVGNQYDWSFK